MDNSDAAYLLGVDGDLDMEQDPKALAERSKRFMELMDASEKVEKNWMSTLGKLDDLYVPHKVAGFLDDILLIDIDDLPMVELDVLNKDGSMNGVPRGAQGFPRNTYIGFKVGEDGVPTGTARVLTKQFWQRAHPKFEGSDLRMYLMGVQSHDLVEKLPLSFDLLLESIALNSAASIRNQYIAKYGQLTITALPVNEEVVLQVGFPHAFAGGRSPRSR
jgi:hypothetical protein